MKVLLLELSNRCDAGCPWCIQKYMKRERGEMELKLVERIADMTEGQKDILWLHFNGESFNHPQLFEAIEIMAKIRERIKIIIIDAQSINVYCQRI